MPREQAMSVLPSADVFLVLLGLNTPWPEEVMGCFPSKLVEYLCVGRPILALSPKGSFVDRLVSQSGCGVVVHDRDPAAIRSAIEGLRDADRRAEMAAAGRRLAGQLGGDLWMERLTECLRLGPATGPSHPGFPRLAIDRGMHDDDGRLAVEKSVVRQGILDAGAGASVARSSMSSVSLYEAFSLG